MNVTATEAKNRFGQVLEEAQVRPVVIEKSGRRHSVLLSARQYDALVAAAQAVPAVAAASPVGEPHSPEAVRFYAQYKDWVDMQNEHYEKYGIFGEEYRVW
jgi:prevent-host-death family protein